MYQELFNMLKIFLCDIQNKFCKKQTDYILNANNPNITKYKERLPKSLQSNIKQSSSKGKHVSRNNTQQIDIYSDENAAKGSKGRKYGKCKQYEHYAKICQTLM
jgi:hypothetical protein